MPGDPKRSVLSDLRKPLAQPTSSVPAGLEERLLGSVTTAAAPSDSHVLPSVAGTPTKPESGKGTTRQRVPTVPVTFHLPIELRDKIKITAQAKQRTMLEIAVEALQDYLDRNQVSEADLRKLLGLK
jgi:hypothetical protein